MRSVEGGDRTLEEICLLLLHLTIKELRPCLDSIDTACVLNDGVSNLMVVFKECCLVAINSRLIYENCLKIGDIIVIYCFLNRYYYIRTTLVTINLSYPKILDLYGTYI